MNHRRLRPWILLGALGLRAASRRGRRCGGRDRDVRRGRGGAHRGARSVAAAGHARSDQPRLRHARGDRLRPPPLLLPAVLAERLRLLCRLPSAGPRVHRQPAACARTGAGRPQRHRPAEPSPAALVRLGRIERQPVDGEPAADPRSRARSAAARRRSPSSIRTGDGVACRYRAAFGADPEGEADETVLVNVGKALAAYEETLVTGRTPFDDFRDALARGERLGRVVPGKRAARAQGLRRHAAIASSCHGGPNFTDGAFRGTGVPSFVGQSAPDTGRYAGVNALRASRFNLRGPYNDAGRSRRGRT